MNVLVYSGPGTTTESVKHCLESLRIHLSPYYAVVTVGEKSLLNDPWQLKTKALVIPGGADTPYCNSFNGAGNRLITNFVRKGGKFIGFCAGGYYAAARCEFEAGTANEVSGSRELGFFPGTCVGTAYKGFVYNSHEGARITPISVSGSLDCPPTVFNYYNGGGVFANADKLSNVEVLGRYTEDLDTPPEAGNAAVVYCRVGKGGALLTGCHPEFGPIAGNSSSYGSREPSPHGQAILGSLQPHDGDRNIFLKACLAKLGLQVNSESSIPTITPIHILSLLDPSKTIKMVETMKTKLDFIGDTFEDTVDTFHLHGPHEVVERPDDGTHLILHVSDAPDSKDTPYFNTTKYFEALQTLYDTNHVKDGQFGQIIGYGEVVTSTSSLLDKNSKWLPYVPHGFVMCATTQVAGRGRGGNVWVNPKGVMAQSVVFRVNPKNARSIVTLQYVLGLALVESIMNYGCTEPGTGAGYEEMPVKLKWPNDIYALKPEFFNEFGDHHSPTTIDGTDEKYAKVSGALVNSQFIDGKFHLVWGAGVNLANEAPTTSLNLILAKLNQIRAKRGLQPLPLYEHEVLLAKIMFTVNQFYSVFEHSGMTPFLPLYYKRWFHSDQVVTVTSDGTTRKCRIQGITEDNGLLVVVDQSSKEKLELQPDGNSFDIFKGLVYRKIQ
ncbi:biotin holocarboxylase synthetase [Yamadazyma tenuis]|uniref:BPL/LPL catalytic domain-containing protein n=1 Tax=Candida tenuis (strain ATCC 10573 / BCRC 21748 / CBS 615 / JCM 9827 / NBRC 10315 / NRRL Y-1498 / VKM Y-70) TaxID=590646 RepID=G3B6Z7_CANTC|nr:uncharacterized protein CANTEDRAFT_122779 [Yamadazyma tenuis ATCC 10573]EGV63058.1 hypothetical protein CANTEDRAFT_122779 [Yamadazyma tenuis ATCC 10573]WEJ97124.1 biotin holocarboxylase synthetase [Yamadazyma tenuis]